MFKILIPEKIPAHNKGEEAIFRGLIETIKFMGETKIFLYSRHPEYDEKAYSGEVEIITETLVPVTEDSKMQKIWHLLYNVPMHLIFAIIYRINRKLAMQLFTGKLWRVYDEIDVVLAAHDSAFAIMHNILVLFCKVINKPIAIYGTSILPFLYERKGVKYLTSFCLRHADLITTREEISYDLLVNRIGVPQKRAFLTADMAFLLKPDNKEQSIDIMKSEKVPFGERKLIGMTVVNKTGIFNTISIAIDEHIAIMTKLVDSLIDTLDVDIVFFPHSIGPDEANDDRVAANKIFHQAKNKVNIHLIDGDYSAASLKGMIGCCDFFVGERTHSVIGAVSMLVPSVVISHPKDFRTIGIIGKAVGLENQIYDISKLTFETLNSFVLGNWAEKENILNGLEVMIPTVKENSAFNGKLLSNMLRDRA